MGRVLRYAVSTDYLSSGWNRLPNYQQHLWSGLVGGIPLTWGLAGTGTSRGSTSYDSQRLLDTTTAPFQHRGRLSWLYDQCFFPSVFGIIPPSASSIIDGVNDQSPGRVMAQDPLVPSRPHHSTMLFFLAPNIPNFHQACIDIPIPTTSVSFHPSSINQHLYGGHRNNKKGSSQQVCYHHGKTEDEGLCVLMDLPRTHWKGITEQRSQGTVS